MWIGLRRDPGFISRTWRWVDGTVVTEPKWGKRQPNNYNGKQDCVALDRGRKWLWNDVGCELGFLPYNCMSAPRSCRSPDKQVNTTMEVTGHSTGQIVTYTCPVGSKLVGNTSRTCLEDGVWSGAAPSCLYIKCGVPDDIEDGSYTYTGRPEIRTRPRLRTHVHKTTRWTGLMCAYVRTPQKPTCLYARCPPLPPPPHSTIQENSNSLKAGGSSPTPAKLVICWSEKREGTEMRPDSAALQ